MSNAWIISQQNQFSRTNSIARGRHVKYHRRCVNGPSHSLRVILGSGHNVQALTELNYISYALP